MISNQHIAAFIKRQTVANVCCTEATHHPWCFSCYYAFDEATCMLYFKSSLETKHIQLLQERPQIAGTILPDKLNKQQIRGIQFEGAFLDAAATEAVNAAMHYHVEYPFALAMPGTVYALQIDFIKMTDNSLGFGKKITWSRTSIPAAD